MSTIHSNSAHGGRSTGGPAGTRGKVKHLSSFTLSDPQGLPVGSDRCLHSLAKPHMTRIGIQSRMPCHQEMKRVQFLRSFHKPQPTIVFDNRCHAASYRKDQFRAGKALQRHAEVRHANTRATFCTDSRQLLVRNCLHPLICGNHDVARGQVLLKWQPVAKVAVACHGANPILLVEPFRLKMRRQEPVINVENKIKLPAFHEFCNAASPGPKFEVDLVASVGVLLA